MMVVSVRSGMGVSVGDGTAVFVAVSSMGVQVVVGLAGTVVAPGAMEDQVAVELAGMAVAMGKLQAVRMQAAIRLIPIRPSNILLLPIIDMPPGNK
jgi:hypothetical protein